MKHCVITGAADGIGKALAQIFGRAGYRITGIDRDLERSQGTEQELVNMGIAVTFLRADLADGIAIERLVEQLKALQRIDVLINNAGISAVGRFGQIDLAPQHAVLDVNLLAPLLLTSALLRADRIVAGGSLVFLSSLSHFVGYPGAAVYAATKDGIASYARSLAVARPEFHVLTVFPGPTRTAHAYRYSLDNSREHRRMAPERLAEQVLSAVQRRRRVLIPGVPNRLFALVGRLMPPVATLLLRKTLLDKLPW